MRRALPLFAWSALLALLAIVLTVWAQQDWLAYTMLWGAAAATLVWALVEWRLGPARDRPRRLPDTSMWTLLIAAGASGALLGALFGAWLAILGGGLVVAGAFGLLRERRVA
jgi:hypothetical protein